MAVQIDIVYQGALRCSATHGPSKQTFKPTRPVDNGGKGAAFSPTDLLATAMGTCMATVMGLVAGRNQLDIEGLQVQVVKEMVADPVRRIGRSGRGWYFPPGKKILARRPRQARSRPPKPARSSTASTPT